MRETPLGWSSAQPNTFHRCQCFMGFRFARWALKCALRFLGKCSCTLGDKYKLHKRMHLRVSGFL
jgi:hypothetical protein